MSVVRLDSDPCELDGLSGYQNNNKLILDIKNNYSNTQGFTDPKEQAERKEGPKRGNMVAWEKMEEKKEEMTGGTHKKQEQTVKYHAGWFPSLHAERDSTARRDFWRHRPQKRSASQVQSSPVNL